MKPSAPRSTPSESATGTHTRRELKLRRETLRQLDEKDLGDVAGGRSCGCQLDHHIEK
ncbi:MAG TPA: hypothetical protein VMZ28_15870 [Kofleriaceae bacterium]|nr:hypothetical protein [Kofleriaceae bacterium]